MAKQEAKHLAQNLRSNLQSLADQLARKPTAFEPQWAKTITDSFKLYTRTRTINYFVALGDTLREKGWPFPVYLDLEREMERSTRALRYLKLPSLLWKFFGWRSFSILMTELAFIKPQSSRKTILDWFVCRRFRKESKAVFVSWRKHPLLQSKRRVIHDLEKAYEKRLWGVCIPSVLPLLDYLMRDYFQTNDLRTSVSTLARAFELAGITYGSVLPGLGIWESLEKRPDELRVADDLEKDLRLPGSYLASFIDFAKYYYAEYSSATEPKELNRHAILHGDMNYWSEEAYTTKILMFFDLALKLEPVLRIVIDPVQQYTDLTIDKNGG